jgi:Tfp pilus assembly PilM family ATPase
MPFLNRTLQALEINQYYANIIEIKKNDQLHLRKAHSIELDKEIIAPSLKKENIKDPSKFLSRIRMLFQESDIKPGEIGLSLPDPISLSYLNEIEVETKGKKQIIELIKWKTHKTNPIPSEELAVNFQIINNPGKKKKVLSFQTSKKIIHQYEDLLRKLKVLPVKIQTNSFNLYNLFYPNFPEDKDFVFISIFPDYFSLFICRNRSPLFYRFKMVSFDHPGFFQEVNNSFLFFNKENQDLSLLKVYYYLWEENSIYRETLEKNFYYIFQKPVVFLKVDDILEFKYKVNSPKNFFGPALGSAISLR